MPMHDATVEDLRGMFVSSVIMAKNKPYYIENISMRKIATALNILTQRREELDMKVVEFSTPSRRLGMINAAGCVFYASRTPVRRYKVGLTRENTTISRIQARQGQNEGHILERISYLNTPEIGDCIFGRYPTFEKALTMVLDDGCPAVAFDRQFCLDARGYVFYKQEYVGNFNRETKTVYDITFKAGREYLITLLDNNHEKNLSNSRKK